MTRRQLIGLAAVLFGITMFAGVVVSGTTPDSTGSEAVAKYTAYWEDSSHQDRAAWGSFILTYACVLLVCLAAGLRYLLDAVDGPLPALVLAAGTGSAAALAAGGALVNGAGIAAAESSGYQVDGNHALLVESIGYYTLTVGIMLAAVMALATALANRRARILPGWTIVLAALVGLGTVGSIFTAWIGFMLVPLWAVVIGLCLLAIRADGEPAAS